MVRLTKAQAKKLEQSGAVVSRKEPTRKAEQAPKPAPKQKVEQAPAANNAALVSAINTLGEKLIAAAKEQPERKPSPYKFTLQRDSKTRLIASCIAEPLT